MRLRKAGIDVPNIYMVDHARSRIFMEFVEGHMIKDYLYSMDIAADENGMSVWCFLPPLSLSLSLSLFFSRSSLFLYLVSLSLSLICPFSLSLSLSLFPSPLPLQTPIHP